MSHMTTMRDHGKRALGAICDDDELTLTRELAPLTAVELLALAHAAFTLCIRANRAARKAKGRT